MKLADAGRNATTLGVCCLSSTIGSNAQRVADFNARGCADLRTLFIHPAALAGHSFVRFLPQTVGSENIATSYRDADLVEHEQAYR